MSTGIEIKIISNQLTEAIKNIVAVSRRKIYSAINLELTITYWKIGAEIVNIEQKNEIDNQTARQIIIDLSKTLTNEIGRGFSRSNLFNMRRFYIEYPDVQTLSGHLSWSHLCELLIIEDKDKRSFYEKETITVICNT